MSAQKPMLASDADEKKIKYPCIVEPKIDGVRSLNITGILTGRSLKKHANKYTTNRFSQPIFQGLDGEMAAEIDTHPDLCRLTTSALNTIEGTPNIDWWLFDRISDSIITLPYIERLENLRIFVNMIQRENVCPEVHCLRLVPYHLVHNHDELLALDTAWLEQGYEGTIIRDPYGRYKDGRSTVREGGLLRIKRFVEEDAVVMGILEGVTNNNEATLNELGLTERSTHKENMVPNGMIGTLLCRDVKTGADIEVAPGKMPHGDRLKYFKNPELILGQTIKYKHFPKGVKDKPRFPTFQSFRAGSDMVTD